MNPKHAMPFWYDVYTEAQMVYLKIFVGPVYTCVRCGKKRNADKVAPWMPKGRMASDLVCEYCSMIDDHSLMDEDPRFGRWMNGLPLDWRK